MSSDAGPAVALVLAPFTSSASWHDAISHPDGRDRLFRLIQYALKFLRGSLAGRNAIDLPPHVARIAQLEVSLSAARQVWRLFKWSGFYSKTSIRALAAPALSPSSLATGLATFQDACLASYMVLDNLTFLTKVSLIHGNVAAASRRAARAWLAASFLGLVNSLRRWHAATSAASPSPKEGSARSRKRGARRHMALAAKYAGDAVVAYSLCRATSDSIVAHPALVGACGVVSSLIGFSDVWPRRGLQAGDSAPRRSRTLAEAGVAAAATPQ
jgi:Peroxisomal biogenesis factor 11 (PEX11)